MASSHIWRLLLERARWQVVFVLLSTLSFFYIEEDALEHVAFLMKEGAQELEMIVLGPKWSRSGVE